MIAGDDGFCPIHVNFVDKFPRNALFAKPLTGYVYFILAQGIERIKIGKTQYPEKRLSALMTDCPVPVLRVAIMACSKMSEMERTLHAELKDYRVHGEWFLLSDRVLDVAEMAHKEGELGVIKLLGLRKDRLL